MGYVKDQDAYTRGAGAIAAADAAGRRRAMAKQRAKARATNRRDARMVRLPQTLGDINLGGGRRYVQAHSTFGVTNPIGGGGPIDTGGGLPGGGEGGWGGWLHGGGGAPPGSKNPLAAKLLGTTSAFRQIAMPPPGGIWVGPWFPQPLPVQTSGGIPVPAQPPPPPQTSGGTPVPSSGGGMVGGGGGGNAGSATDPSGGASAPSGPLAFLSNLSTTEKLALGAAALGGLYLVFRKKGA